MAKSIATLVFKPGALSIHADSSGRLVFDPDHVEVERLEDKDAAVAVVDIPTGELKEICAFLLTHLPRSEPLLDQRAAVNDRRAPTSDSTLLGPRVGARMGHERRLRLKGTIADRMNYRDVACALGAYALNAAYGAPIADFELSNIISLAAKVGCKVVEQQRAFGPTRIVLGEIMAERRRQVGLGYTHSHDDKNPLKMHDEVMTRVAPLPTIPETRPKLIEAAAIIVAEIERLDRQGQPA